MTPAELAEHAYRLAEQGIPVFPCAATKQPAIPRAQGGHGLYDASTTPDQVRSLFRSCPNAALIGMPTGTCSGIVVIDIDPAAIVWARQNIAIGRFPETRIHQTRRGGYHLLYQCPDEPIKNSAGKLHKGCDTRGEGGYVCIPPSDGYTVIHEVDIAPLPKWIILSLNRKPKSPVQNDSNKPVANGNLDALIRFVSQSGMGERNVRAFWSSCRAGELVRAGKVALVDARSALVAAAMQTGLDAAEAQTVIMSGLRRGQQEMRGK